MATKVKHTIAQKRREAPVVSFVNAQGELEVTDDRRIKGYAIIWGKVNEHKERLHKGCCERSIREHGPGSSSKYKIKFLNNHDPKEPCALIEVLKEDETGLYFETAPFDDVPWANNLLTQIRSKTIDNYSYGFDYVFQEGKMKWNDDEGLWDLYEIRLFEISAATIPSGLETYTVRNKRDIIEEFIISLPASKRMEARKIFALVQQEKSKSGMKPTQTSNKPPNKRKAIDYNFLTKNY